MILMVRAVTILSKRLVGVRVNNDKVSALQASALIAERSQTCGDLHHGLIPAAMP